LRHSVHPFNALFSRATWVRQYPIGKTSLDLNEARDDGILRCSGISWTICKQSAFEALLSRHITTSAVNTSSLIFYSTDALPDAQPT